MVFSKGEEAKLVCALLALLGPRALQGHLELELKAIVSLHIGTKN